MPGITLGWNPDCEPLASDCTPSSLRAAGAGRTLCATDEDQQIQRLRDLIREVVKLQEVTNQLIAELSDRLRRSDRASKSPIKERRKKPR